MHYNQKNIPPNKARNPESHFLNKPVLVYHKLKETSKDDEKMMNMPSGSKKPNIFSMGDVKYKDIFKDRPRKSRWEIHHTKLGGWEQDFYKTHA